MGRERKEEERGKEKGKKEGRKMREGDRQLTTSGRSEEKDVTLAKLWTIFLLC